MCDTDRPRAKVYATRTAKRWCAAPTILRRLFKSVCRRYEEATAALIEYYREMDFHTVDGSDNPAMVLEAIEAALGLPVW